MIISNAFKRQQTQTRLDQVHGSENYYWYLYCEETKRKALNPLGDIIQRLGGSCLDIGCGGGWLANYVGNIQYTGIDASSEAIRNARENHSDHRQFEVVRLEDFINQNTNRQFDTLIFGNVLWLLVKSDYYVSIIKQFINCFNSKYFIIYDLQRLKTKDIDNYYECIEAFGIELDIPNIPSIKRYRQVKVYQCE